MHVPSTVKTAVKFLLTSYHTAKGIYTYVAMITTVNIALVSLTTSANLPECICVSEVHHVEAEKGTNTYTTDLAHEANFAEPH